MSKIYLVKRTDDIGHDEYEGHVVIAKSPSHALELCKEIAADEGKDIWLSDSTETRLLGSPINHTPRIVLSYFNAG